MCFECWLTHVADGDHRLKIVVAVVVLAAVDLLNAERKFLSRLFQLLACFLGLTIAHHRVFALIVARLGDGARALPSPQANCATWAVESLAERLLTAYTLP